MERYPWWSGASIPPNYRQARLARDRRAHTFIEADARRSAKTSGNDRENA
jgi:hypothetical protein